MGASLFRWPRKIENSRPCIRDNGMPIQCTPKLASHACAFVNKKIVAISIGAAVLLAILVIWWMRRGEHSNLITLHGNVDLRQVELPFSDGERIAEVLV